MLDLLWEDSQKKVIIRCARSTWRTSRLISKPSLRRCPKRSVWRLQRGGKVLLDAPEDKGMDVIAVFDKWRKWPIG